MAISVYAYKDRLAADFDQSLNRSMEEYGPNKERSYDFDVMQETVSILKNVFLGYKITLFSLFSSSAVASKGPLIGVRSQNQIQFPVHVALHRCATSKMKHKSFPWVATRKLWHF